MTKIENYLDEFVDSGEVVEVEPEEYKAVSDGVLRTGELDRCIGVAAYDRESDTGYMTHVSGFRGGLQDFVDDIKVLLHIIKDRSDLEDVEFFLGGSSMENPFGVNGSSYPDDWKDIRSIGGQRFAAEKYLESFSDEVTVEWGSEDGYFAELILDMDDPEIFSYDRKKNP